jgi:hypothetical protein
MSVSHRPITDYLRDAYGATAIDVRPGGKHQSCEFYLADKRFKITLPVSPSDHHWIDIKKGDIRRLLGPPPEPNGKPEPRTLESMTADLKPLGNGAAAMAALTSQPQAPPTDSAHRGGMAHYGTKTSLSLPPEVTTLCLPPGTPVVINRLGEHRWRLRKAPAKDRTTPVVKQRQGKTVSVEFDVARLTKGLPTFGFSPADYAVVNSFTVEVTLLADQLRPVQVRKKRNAKPVADKHEGVVPMGGGPTVAASKRQRPVRFPTAVGWVDPPKQPITALRWREDPRREALRLIREVETTSEYRLKRVKVGDIERWEWRAPAISLEDE